MPIASRWTIPIPEVSLQEWVFGSSFEPLAPIKAFVDAEQPDSHYLTLSDFRLLSKRVALGLKRAGLHDGDRVLSYAGNSIYFPAIFMGVIMAGGIFTGASPAFGCAELASQVKDSGAQFIVAQDTGVAIAVEAARKVGLADSRIFSLDGSLSPAPEKSLAHTKHWSELLASAPEAEQFDWTEPTNPRDTICCLNYSSGTTGLPKGVEITHYSYVANGVACIHMEMLKRSTEEPKRLETSIGFMPMYHAAGQTTFAVNNPKMGITTAVMPAYQLEKVLSCIERFKVRSLNVAPPVILQIAKSPITAKYDLSSLQEIICGTAPLPPEVALEAERKLWPNGDKFIHQGWGMTEVTCAGALWSHDDRKKGTSVGELVPNASLRIRDGSKEITEPNVPGELWFSGPTVMRGYWLNPKATSDTVVDENGVRWLKTGDVAYVDRFRPGAKIYLVDRVKELIKVRGFQVSPSELEGVLLSRPDIVDACVVGVSINHEEVPRAYIVKNSNTTEQEIIRWIEDRVAKYKRLRGGVVFVNSIPRTQTGKILRRKLRETASGASIEGIKGIAGANDIEGETCLNCCSGTRR